MALHLADLRNSPQPGPVRFLRWQPGCFVQYYDDTPAKDPWKARSARAFVVATARLKQLAGCAVCFSLQAFCAARTKEGLLSYRNMGVDVDLVSAAERRVLLAEDIDRRKQDYLTRVLATFPLQPHWLIETKHGFHVVFRVLPLREPARVREAEEANRRLVRALHGDENAALLTQVFRVPGTLQFKGRPQPFLCRLLVDNAATIPPHDIRDVRTVLDAWEAFHPAPPVPNHTLHTGTAKASWRGALAGVPEGARNAAAAALAGAILCRLPEHLWEAAGWGGLKEWNARNSVPLPEPELRAVFESIARRERNRRWRAGPALKGQVSRTPPNSPLSPSSHVEH